MIPTKAICFNSFTSRFIDLQQLASILSEKNSICEKCYAFQSKFAKIQMFIGLSIMALACQHRWKKVLTVIIHELWFPKLSVSIHSNTSINCTTSRFFNFTASKLSMYAQFWCWVIGSWQMPSKSGESIEKVDNWWWMAVRMWLQFDRRTTAGTSRDLTELRASDPMGHYTWVDTIREVKVG